MVVTESKQGMINIDGKIKIFFWDWTIATPASREIIWSQDTEGIRNEYMNIKQYVYKFGI